MDPTLTPSSSIKADIAELGVLARRLAEADRDFLVFGSSAHQYEFCPTLSEAELTAFEARHGIELPLDYRWFLAHVGNGGPGPDYGLKRLKDQTRDLTRPFPGTDDFDLPEDPMSDEEYLPGILCICHHGCDHYTYLVVNGPAYGSVFFGTAEAEFRLSSPSFAAWYRRWVDGKLRLLDNLRLLDRIHPGMQRSDVEAMVPGEWSLVTNSFLEWRKLRHAEVPLDINLDTNQVVTRVQRAKSV